MARVRTSRAGEKPESGLKHFIILGNAMTGTSILTSLLDSHPTITCKFEWKFKHPEYNEWFNDREKSFDTWGNKHTIEKLCSNGWRESDLIDLADNWHIISIERKYSSYRARFFSRAVGLCKYAEEINDSPKFWWHMNNRIYYAQREKAPDRVLRVSFEDFVLRQVAETARILSFLEVEYDGGIVDHMLKRAPQKVRMSEKRKYIMPSKAFE